jgi:hypothetical protein
MKKFIFTTSVFAILFLVPAVLVGYLSETANPAKPATGEVAKKTTDVLDYGSLVRLVKTF